MNKKIVNKANMVRFIVIIGVIIIPLMYSFFYLSAFWDPYSKLNNLPVALVNNDAGATISNQQRNLGEEFIDELIKDGTFKYVITDEATAKAGTESDDYYAMIVVPQNFSNNIASAATVNKQTASIIFSPNEKRNYLASQILGKAEMQMETSLRESISGDFWHSFLILVIYLVVFFAATIVLTMIKKKKAEKEDATVKAELNSDQLF